MQRSKRHGAESPESIWRIAGAGVQWIEDSAPAEHVPRSRTLREMGVKRKKVREEAGQGTSRREGQLQGWQKEGEKERR